MCALFFINRMMLTKTVRQKWLYHLIYEIYHYYINYIETDKLYNNGKRKYNKCLSFSPLFLSDRFMNRLLHVCYIS